MRGSHCPASARNGVVDDGRCGMTDDPSKTSRYRFGAFELDAGAVEIRKYGTRIRLQQKPFQALLLLGKSGVLVTREELRAKLWDGDTFVEFDDSLNHVIKRLRDALSDSADVPRFIETVPGRGYRFIAAVETIEGRESRQIDPAGVPGGQSDLEPQAQKTPPSVARAKPVTPIVIAAAAVLLVAVGLTWWLARSSETAAPPQYKLTQITRDTGYTADPALSPNGQLLAYASDRQGDGNIDIWVQQLTGGGNPVRVTQHEADDHAPSFSPDSSRIVFLSDRDNSGIYVIPALGGSPTRIGRGGLEWVMSEPHFSPDGKWVSYSRARLDSDSRQFSHIEIVPASGGSPRIVEIDLPIARAPIWSPDGQHLMCIGSEEPGGYGKQIDLDWWLVPAAGGEPVRLGARGLFERHGIVGARNTGARQCLLRGRAQSGPHFTFVTPDRSGVEEGGAGLSRGRNDPLGDGQPLHAQPQVADGFVRREIRRRAGTPSRRTTRLSAVG